MALIINKNNMAAMSQSHGARPAASERLSSGLKLNSSADDAAGLAISEKMRSDVRDLSRTANEHNELLSVLQNTDEALMRISEALGEMKRLAELIRTGSASPEETAGHIARYEDMKSEIDHMAVTGDFGRRLFCSGKAPGEEGQLSIQFGPGGGTKEACSINFVDGTASGLGVANTSISTPEQAHAAHEAILTAMIKVDEFRSYFGSVQAKL